MIIIEVSTWFDVNTGEQWPEAWLTRVPDQHPQLDGAYDGDKIANAAWDLVHVVHGGLPPVKRYRITIEPA